MHTSQPLPNASKFLVSVPYSAEQQRGVTILVLVSCISLVAVVVLLLTIAISAFINRASRDKQLFVKNHLSAYFISLLLCNLVQAIASVISIVWIRNMGVFYGSACVLQGILTQASDLGIAVWSMVISGHIFCELSLGWNTRKSVLRCILISGWSTITAFVALGPATMSVKKGPFYGISGHWCWISPKYKTEQVVLDRLLMFLFALLSLGLCIFAFSRLRRNSSAHQSNEGNMHVGQDSNSAQVKTIRFAKQMLVYPVTNAAIILPLVISQFVSWGGKGLPFGATIFCMAIFLLSGLVNVILFIAIRPVKTGQQSLDGPCDQDRDQHQQSHQAITHSRTASDASDSTLVSISKRTKLRPPDIIITRDSFESVYSSYDEEHPVARNAAHSAPAMSCWSPDGSPRNRLFV